MHVTGRELLVRERLLDRLRSRWVVPLTVVQAPAGYGKTTLLTQARSGNAAAPLGVEAWVPCGPPMAVVSSLGAALCDAIGARWPGRADPGELATAAGNDLAARRALRRYREAIRELGLGPDEATLMMERLLDALPKVRGR